MRVSLFSKVLPLYKMTAHPSAKKLFHPPPAPPVKGGERVETGEERRG